jgi:glucoamylase
VPLSPLCNTSRKDMIGGTPARTRLWFTIAEGMVTEVFYPRVDLAQIKELNFIIADGQGSWVDLPGIPDYDVDGPEPGAPALTVRHRHDRFCLISKICSDPLRDVVPSRY